MTEPVDPRPTLDELFGRIGKVPKTPLPPVQRPVAGRSRDPVQRFQRAAKAALFATTFLECGGDAIAAYRKAFAVQIKARGWSRTRVRNRARRWATLPQVTRAINEKLREILTNAVEASRYDVERLLMVNEAIIDGNVVHYLRPRPDVLDGDGKVVRTGGFDFVIPPGADWRDCVAIQQIALAEDGSIAGVKLYDRQKAMDFQRELLALAREQGKLQDGNEAARVNKLRNAIRRARTTSQAIAEGKVVPLITQASQRGQGT